MKQWLDRVSRAQPCRDGLVPVQQGRATQESRPSVYSRAAAERNINTLAPHRCGDARYRPRRGGGFRIRRPHHLKNVGVRQSRIAQQHRYGTSDGAACLGRSFLGGLSLRLARFQRLDALDERGLRRAPFLDLSFVVTACVVNGHQLGRSHRLHVHVITRSRAPGIGVACGDAVATGLARERGKAPVETGKHEGCLAMPVFEDGSCCYEWK